MSLKFNIYRKGDGVVFEIFQEGSLIYGEFFTSFSFLKERFYEIIEECNKGLKEGEDIFSLIEKEKSALDKKEEDMNPVRLWERIEQMGSEDEVISFFNSLSLEVRKTLSSYILSSVNMFKGKGVIFAQYFDHKRCILDK